MLLSLLRSKLRSIINLYEKSRIIHCWGGCPEYCWYPWVKKQLEPKCFEVIIPAFPDPDAPNLKKWLPVLEKNIGSPNKDVFLIGHSVGCITILRYLETLEEDQKIGGVVMVGGFTDNLSCLDGISNELTNFFETPIKWKKIKNKANTFVAIHSDDDPYVKLEYGDEFKEKLGAELIIKNKMGHFSGPVDKTKSCTELPDVIEAIEKMS